MVEMNKVATNFRRMTYERCANLIRRALRAAKGKPLSTSAVISEVRQLCCNELSEAMVSRSLSEFRRVGLLHAKTATQLGITGCSGSSLFYLRIASRSNVAAVLDRSFNASPAAEAPKPEVPVDSFDAALQVLLGFSPEVIFLALGLIYTGLRDHSSKLFTRQWFFNACIDTSLFNMDNTIHSDTILNCLRDIGIFEQVNVLTSSPANMEFYWPCVDLDEAREMINASLVEPHKKARVVELREELERTSQRLEEIQRLLAGG